MIRANADVNASSRAGATALMYAALGGHVAVVLLLAEARANVHARAGGDGKTALDAADVSGHVSGHVSAHEEVALLLSSLGGAEEDLRPDTAVDEVMRPHTAVDETSYCVVIQQLLPSQVVL